MSTIERNKGKLIPVYIDTENFTEDDFDNLYENGMVLIGDEVYQVEWEIKRELDCSYFADVKQNNDGTIDFHTLHYNGGCHWSELIEDALNESNN